LILVLHNRYRTTGGEERVVEDLLWLLREQMNEDAELLTRESSALSQPRAAVAMLRGGLDPGDVAAAVRRTRARIVHVHNLNPGFGWRALAAARAAGARVVMHLHNYRLVCAVGTCFTQGTDCIRCHGRDTLPGVRLNCRGERSEAAVYGAALALWQRRLAACVDVFVVPSDFAHERLRALEAPIGDRVAVVPHLIRSFASRSRADEGEYALVASRLAPEKGVDVAIEACARAGVPLRVAGDGPQAAALRADAAGDVEFLGRLEPAEMARAREGAGLAIVPSRSAETFGLAAAEAMAAGVPVVASRAGALTELVDHDSRVPPGDARALAAAVTRSYRDAQLGARGLERVRAVAAPERVAARLDAAYQAAAALGAPGPV
jgi:glycosyltransferase involved in cell wall biosynthesis